MKTSVETLTDIPASDLQQTSAEFSAAGGVVTAVLQADGNWTLVAIFNEPAQAAP